MGLNQPPLDPPLMCIGLVSSESLLYALIECCSRKVQRNNLVPQDICTQCKFNFGQKVYSQNQTQIQVCMGNVHFNVMLGFQFHYNTSLLVSLNPDDGAILLGPSILEPTST